jgi:hypothetical protein
MAKEKSQSRPGKPLLGPTTRAWELIVGRKGRLPGITGEEAVTFAKLIFLERNACKSAGLGHPHWGEAARACGLVACGKDCSAVK